MKNKHMQMNKILVMMLCAAMTVEPAAVYGADFTDGIEIKTEIPEALCKVMETVCRDYEYLIQ